MSNTYDLNNKKILITGANGNIGQAYTMALLESRAFVYVTDIQPKIDVDFKKTLDEKGFVSYQYIQMDVTSYESIKKAEAEIQDGIDVLINNAGFEAIRSQFEDRSADELDKILDINVKGAILCAKVFSKKMVERKSGRIINTGSIYGVVAPDKRIYGDSGQNKPEIYGMTKAALIQFTKYLAAHLGEHGVTSVCVSPGGVFNDQKQFFLDHYIPKVPLGRMAEVSDLTGVMCFLCSDDSSYINGENILVDGGFTAW